MALERALALLAAFEHRAEWRLVDIARETGLSEATALRYLSTLVHHRIVERDGEGTYYGLPWNPEPASGVMMQVHPGFGGR